MKIVQDHFNHLHHINHIKVQHCKSYKLHSNDQQLILFHHTTSTMATSQVLSSLEGLSVAVTGGSSGLGFGTVERLSKLGCIVAIIDVNEPKRLPNNSYFIKADVTSEKDVLKALEIIEEKAKKLDVLVNCAGIMYRHSVFDMKSNTPHPLSDFERILKVNLTGTFNVIRLCCSLFNKNEPNENKQRGVIINTSSMAAHEGAASFVAYATSKAALVGMTLPLARDLAPMGVRVMAISPGCFLTGMKGDFSEEFLDAIIQSMPFPRRFGDPDEFAHLVQAIIENPMLNGEYIRIDGALRQNSVDA